jgi:hypothetical protein
MNACGQKSALSGAGRRRVLYLADILVKIERQEPRFTLWQENARRVLTPALPIIMALEAVYVHFPKAAGTSLVQALKEHYGDESMADYSHPPVPGRDGHLPVLAPNTRAVYGHFHADRYSAYRSAFRFTFLREPVDNLISIFYFWRTFPPSNYPPHQRFLSEEPTIFEFAEYPEIRRLASSCYFGGVDISKLDFVGFFERRTDDLRKLSTQLGFSLRPEIVLNRTSNDFRIERAELAADTRAIASLRSRLAEDVAFYQRAYERWA